MIIQLFARSNRLRTLPLWLRLSLAPAVVCAWALLRIAILGEHPGWPYEMFIPVVVVSNLCLGPVSGYIAAVLSSTVAAWAFVPPTFSFVTLDDPVELVGFCVSIAINVTIVWMIEQIRTHEIRQVETNAAMADVVKQLQQAHSENIMLSAEYEHRMRNDLQRLLGTVMLQAKQTTAADDACQALASVKYRIEAMLSLQARLHKLTPLDSRALIDTQDFLAGIIEDVFQTIELRPVSIDKDVGSYHVPIRRAELLGIIVNEAVTNALKYAFPDNRSGCILVKYEQHGDGFTLIIEDNGVGISSGTPLHKTGLGSDIIRSVAAQLNGMVCLTNSHSGGTSLKVYRPADTTKQIYPAAQEHQLAERRTKRFAVIAPEVGNRLKA